MDVLLCMHECIDVRTGLPALTHFSFSRKVAMRGVDKHHAYPCTMYTHVKRRLMRASLLNFAYFGVLACTPSP